jgi:hypothetical protein
MDQGGQRDLLRHDLDHAAQIIEQRRSHGLCDEEACL